MPAYSGSEWHELAHGHIHDSGHRRNDHIDICVRNHGPTATIDNLPVNTGCMIQIFVGDSIGSGGSKMSIAPGTNRRFHDRSSVIEQIGLLISEIDLHRVLS